MDEVEKLRREVAALRRSLAASAREIEILAARSDIAEGILFGLTGYLKLRVEQRLGADAKLTEEQSAIFCAFERAALAALQDHVEGQIEQVEAANQHHLIVGLKVFQEWVEAAR